MDYVLNEDDVEPNLESYTQEKVEEDSSARPLGARRFRMRTLKNEPSC